MPSHDVSLNCTLFLLVGREVVHYDEFLSLSAERVAKLISSDRLTVTAEEQVNGHSSLTFLLSCDCHCCCLLFVYFFLPRQADFSTVVLSLLLLWFLFLVFFCLTFQLKSTVYLSLALDTGASSMCC